MATKLMSIAKIKGGIEDKDKKASSTAITNQHRADWNGYVKWLETQKMRGNPELDKGDMGKQMLAKYIKQNPKTSLTLDIVQPIQADFSNYRNYALEQVKSGKAVLEKGVTPETFMAELSKLDAYPGSLTTRHSFPYNYMNFLDQKGKLEKVENKGFATIKPK